LKLNQIVFTRDLSKAVMVFGNIVPALALMTKKMHRCFVT